MPSISFNDVLIIALVAAFVPVVLGLLPRLPLPVPSSKSSLGLSLGGVAGPALGEHDQYLRVTRALPRGSSCSSMCYLHGWTVK